MVIQLTPIDRSDHLVSLLENLVLTLEERQQRAVERAALARTLNAYIGRAEPSKRPTYTANAVA